jgi:C-terminal processing protease CtpA/Prc
MRKLICLLPILLCSISSFSQTFLTENQKLESLCKVWGFLKYYHPTVVKGNIDWDHQLVKYIPMVISCRNKQELSNLYLDLIYSLGKPKECKKSQRTIIPDSLKYNLNIGWIENHDLFSDSLISILVFIRENRSWKTNYNAKQNFWHMPLSFENKQPYSGMVFPGKEYRLLSLFRFWNVINYYYPYKYVIGEDWNLVLTEMTNKFKSAKDTTDYHLALAELNAKINDSHSGSVTLYTLKYFGHYWVPFKIKIIDEKAMVTGFYSDSLSKVDDIKQGDVILTINNKSISEIVTERSKYFCASNKSYKLFILSFYLLNGISDTARITFERDGKTYQKSIHRYQYKDLHMTTKVFINNFSNDTNAMMKILENHIGYVNMGKLTKDQVHKVMKKMMTMDAIIFDIRNYPHGTARKIAKYLNEDRKACVVYSTPLKGNPGIFQYEKPQYAGSRNSKYYKGKVVILANELTISHAEYSCMILQTAKNAKVIGSQTAGADGTIAYFTFPGGYKTAFTGIGIFYPDGSKTQRIGIVPNIKVTPTIDEIRNGRDEVLDRAIQFILTSN